MQSITTTSSLKELLGLISRAVVYLPGFPPLLLQCMVTFPRENLDL